MRVIVQTKQGEFPDLTYGGLGAELSCFVPENYEWRQISYGQGEGEVEISGCGQWGFFYNDDSNLVIHLLGGVVDIDVAFTFIKEVTKKVQRNCDNELVSSVIATDP